MSKKRKGGGKRHHGGGRVTPKGTRPGQSPRTSPPAGPSGAGALGGPGDPSGAGGPSGAGLGGPSGPGGPGPGGPGTTEDPFDLFDLPGDDPFEDPFDEPPPGRDLLDDLVAGLATVDQTNPVLVEMWGASLIGGLRMGLQPPSPFDLPAEDDEDADAPPTEEEFFGGMVARFADRASQQDGELFLQALIAVAPYLVPGADAVATDATATGTATTGAPEAATAARDAITQLSRLHPRPAWADVVGSAVVERSFIIDHETDDGHNIGLVARHPGAADTHLLMVLVDVNNGDMAKDVLISDNLDGILEEALAVDGLTMTDLDPADARARIEAAFAQTDMTLDAPVSDDFDEARPMVELLLTTMPPAAALEEPDLPPRDELDALVEQVLAAPETAASALTADQLRQTASLMVQFVSQWCGRPPLSWSPTRLDIFLGDFVPRKVSAPPDELQHLPQALADMVPAAHRLQGWGDRHVADALESIERVTPMFREALAEPDVAGPAKQMMMRALAEGIDVEDPDQLAALMARVNEMGGVDVFASGEDLEFPDED